MLEERQALGSNSTHPRIWHRPLRPRIGAFAIAAAQSQRRARQRTNQTRKTSIARTNDMLDPNHLGGPDSGMAMLERCVRTTLGGPLSGPRSAMPHGVPRAYNGSDHASPCLPFVDRPAVYETSNISCCHMSGEIVLGDSAAPWTKPRGVFLRARARDLTPSPEILHPCAFFPSKWQH